MKLSRVLWIEDSANYENTTLAAPVLLAGIYDLRVALDATEGLKRLKLDSFDAVVVDIRLPPGDDARWVDMYYGFFRSNSAARLGLQLLEVVLPRGKRKWKDSLVDTSKDPLRYGVLTVENKTELAKDLTRLGVGVCNDKGNGEDPDVLLNTIEAILRKQQ